MGEARRDRRGRRAGLVLACAVALLAGCSGGTAVSGPPTAAPAPAPAPAPVPALTGTPEEQALAWTESVCAAVVPVVARLTAAPAVRLDAPEETRQAYLGYLSEGIATTDRARAALGGIGAAPVPDGDAITEQVRGDVADLRADLVDARTQVERADPGSTVALARALVSGSRLIGALLNGAQVAGTINRNPLLHDAYGRAPSCALLQRSGAPPPTTASAPPVAPTR